LIDLLEACFDVQPEPINVAQFICVGEPLVAEIVAGLGKISTSRDHRFFVETERPMDRFHRFALTFPQREAATRFLNIPDVFLAVASASIETAPTSIEVGAAFF